MSGDAQDLFERLLRFYDEVGAAYVAAHEKVAVQVDEYQSRLASSHDCLSRAAVAQIDLVHAVAAARADLMREIARAYDSAFRTRD